MYPTPDIAHVLLYYYILSHPIELYCSTMKQFNVPYHWLYVEMDNS